MSLFPAALSTLLQHTIREQAAAVPRFLCESVRGSTLNGWSLQTILLAKFSKRFCRVLCNYSDQSFTRRFPGKPQAGQDKRCPNSGCDWWPCVYRFGTNCEPARSVLIKNYFQSFALQFPDKTAAGARRGMSAFENRLVDRRLQRRGVLRTSAVLRRDPMARNRVRIGRVPHRRHAAERW